jgi:hypothetical protein
MARMAFALSVVFWVLTLGEANAQCPTPTCVPWTVPSTIGDANIPQSRYSGAIESRSDPRLSSTALQTDCVKFDTADPRPIARNCDLLPTKDRRVQ